MVDFQQTTDLQHPGDAGLSGPASAKPGAAPARAETVLVRTPAQWRAVSSPARIDLVNFLAMAGPCSVRELGEMAGRPADGLYHHLRVLISARLVREVGRRPAGRRTEVLYDLVAHRLVFDFDSQTARNSRAYLRVADSVLRATQSACHRVVPAGGLTLDGPAKDLWCRIESARLTPAALAKVNRHLNQITRIFAEARRPSGRSPKQSSRIMQLSLVMIPSADVKRRTLDRRSPSARPVRDDSLLGVRSRVGIAS